MSREILRQSENSSPTCSEDDDRVIEIDSDLDSITFASSQNQINPAAEHYKIDESNTDSHSDEGFDLMVPLSLLTSGSNSKGNDCSVLVQALPRDAPTLDFHGASGAVGRFEINDDSGN